METEKSAETSSLTARCHANTSPPFMKDGVAPDEAVAWVLVERALQMAPSFALALKQSGVALVVEAQSAEWVRPVFRVLCQFTATLEPAHGDDEEPSPAEHAGTHGYDYDDDIGYYPTAPTSPEPTHPRWAWLACTGEGPQAQRETDENNVLSALAEGRAVMAVTAANTHLPPCLQIGADHRLALDRIDGSALAQAALLLDGALPTATIRDDLCRFLTPADIRFACRPGEDGDRWIARLAALASARATTKKGPTLADLYGMEEAADWGANLIQDLKDFAAGRLSWQEVDRGCLLLGPPGTGKTTYAQALARSAGLPLVTASHGLWQAAGHQGQMLAAMRATFEQARALSPCILFVDEIDAFPDRSSLEGQHREYTHQVVNALLELMDGTFSRPGVIMVAASNSRRIDPALIRPGRLERIIEVPLPSDAALARILRHHLGSDHLAGVDLHPFVVGMAASGADCEFWARGAKRQARRAKRPMHIEDLLAQIPQRPEPTPDLRHRIAIHEAGHAIVAALEMPGQMKLAKLHREGSGVLLASVNANTEPEIRAHIRILLAGRAAEELTLGSIGMGSGGPSYSDLARATGLAAEMIVAHGFGDKLIWSGDVRAWGGATLASALTADSGLTAQIEEVLSNEYQRVLELLRSCGRILSEVAELLQRHGTLSGQMVEELVAAMGHKATITS